ncbi:hypothetical protein GTQ99_24065, partial [Kineococcus sp. T13]|uniref:hypothetical protein n=1 Tax=Kineococcus vitellinus TaxID=2696565 RepID=UPI0014120442
FLVRPALAELPEDLLAGLVALAYPVGDVVVLAMLVRVSAAAGRTRKVHESMPKPTARIEASMTPSRSEPGRAWRAMRSIAAA